MNLTTHLHLVQNLRICGILPICSYKPSRCFIYPYGQIHLLLVPHGAWEYSRNFKVGQVKGVSFTVCASTEDFSLRKPAFTSTYSESCCVRGHNKRDTLHWVHIRTTK